MKTREKSRWSSTLLSFLLLGCGAAYEPEAQRSGAQDEAGQARGLALARLGEPSAAATTELSAMTFNIFYGADELDLATGEFCEVTDGCEETLPHVADVIRAAGADVVGIQEPERNTPRLAQALGWHFDERNHVIARFPIIDPPDGQGAFVYVEVAPGKVVAVANVHLPSDPYGPYLVRDGGNATELAALERTLRLPAISNQLQIWQGLLARHIPLILTGDFNSPSHLDWTPAVARARPEVKFPFVWPVSQALAEAGLRDTYRVAHPDPLAMPGFTWTPGGPEEDAQEIHDRIDWVLAGGPIATLESAVVGEQGGPDVEIGASPYPSDHRAVVSRLSVRAAPMPLLIAVSARRVFVGEPLRVRFHANEQRPSDVVLSRARDVGARRNTVEASRPTDFARDGTFVFETSSLPPGRYEALLLDRERRVLSRVPFWLYARGTEPSVSVQPRRYGVGQPIDVSWRAAPGRGFDWLGVYRCSASGCAETSDYLLYRYIDASIEGRATIGPDARAGAESWPLPVGRYVVRLLTDDSYQQLAVSRSFTIGPGSR